ncbi:MAG: LamG domain-containing protein, partial [Rhodospirillaceae bacterium]|nr:LamG domain-containing protein [Rhodospirillaceae bacterium]
AMNSQVPANAANLVGYWKLDEGSGVVAHNLAEYTALEASATGASGAALSTLPIIGDTSAYKGATFNGTGAIRSASQFEPGTGNFSVEMWINPSSVSGGTQVLFAKDAAENGHGLSIFLSGSTLAVQGAGLYNGGFSLSAASAITANAWQHVALTRSGTSVSTYHTATLDDFSNGIPTLIGDRFAANSMTTLSATEHFTGSMSEVRMWSTARSASDIQTNMDNRLVGNEAGLVDYLPLNESGANGFHEVAAKPSGLAAAYGAAGINANDLGITGVASSAYDAQHLNGTGFITIEMWVKPSSVTAGNQVLAAKDASNNGTGWMLYLNNGTLTFNGGGASLTGSTALTAATWEHVAITRSGGTLTLYLNGSAVGTTSGASGDMSNGLPLMFGARLDPGGGTELNLTGDISDVRVWSTARTSSEISTNMGHRLTGNESGLVDYLPLNEAGGTSVHDYSAQGTYASGTTWTTGNHADIVVSHQQSSALTFAGGQYASAGNVFNPAS